MLQIFNSQFKKKKKFLVSERVGEGGREEMWVPDFIGQTSD